jgi:hypothetical protein
MSIALRMGEPLKGLQVPQEVVSRIVGVLREDQSSAGARIAAERTRLEARLASIRTRMDKAYEDKLDGNIEPEFWDAR